MGNKVTGEPMITPDEFFGEQVKPRRLFDSLLVLANDIGPSQKRITKRQVAFRRKRAFAWAWMPGSYLHGGVTRLS